MKEELTRFAALLTRVGVDLTTPGVRELVAALHDERTRRFVEWLTSEDAEEALSASQKIAALAARPEGEALLIQAVHEILFGTETISLAALALLASRESRAPDRFHQRAALALRNLTNQDAVVYLCLLAARDGVSLFDEGWRAACFLQLNSTEDGVWSHASKIFGFDWEQIISSITELTRRRLLLPDTDTGRAGGGPPSIFFGFTPTSLRFYEVLYASLAIAEDIVLRALHLPSPTDVRLLWEERKGGSTASEPTNA